MLVDEQAEADLEAARAWYREIGEHLDEKFEASVRLAIGAIVEFPEAREKLYREARRQRLKGFQYNLYYRWYPERSLVLVVACTHVRQAPSTWQSRF